MKYVGVAALLISLAALPSPAMCAQATGSGGTIRGTVTDPSGAVVAGADVTITNVVTDHKEAAKTDGEGAFRLANIPPNQYHLSVVLSGFQTYTQDVSVRTQVPIQLKINLALASATETVNVEATPDTIENVPSAHIDVTQNLMADLPITSPGQGLSDTITLTSGGVVADSNGFFHPQGDHGETTYVVDGQPISDQQNKVFSTQLPANAFQSLELISTGITAEYGDKTSLVVNTVTKSGLGQKPTGSFDAYYGSFGTVGEDATFGIGGAKWGNFLVADSSRTGRFLDAPEFTPFHDKGNTESIWDRVDYVPTGRDSLHLNAFVGRNWFQIPNTYDQLQQDQRQQSRTLDLALGYQHTFGASTLLSVDPFFREDHINYYPSRDPFDDSPATIEQDRHLTNWGTTANLSYAHGIHNVKVGTEISQTRLIENFGLGITDPAFNPICLTTAGAPVTIPTLTNPNSCVPLGYVVNPNLSPGLIQFDLTRGGTPFIFHGNANINQQAFYAMDQMIIKNLTLNVGLRFDNYEGISTDNLLQPRFGFSYLFKPTNTVIRASYTRAMETPYNENLVLSSTTGTGGLDFGAYGSHPLRPGHRNEYSVGLQQAIMKFLRVDATYFWKYTKGAFDFDTLLNTSIAFPIAWQQSKIDGASVQISTTNMHGFMAYSSLGHTRARFFPPETGGLIFNSPLNTSVFRIDHDQAFQATNYIRYQHGKDGVWAMFTWRYDSGEVAGSVTDLADALALSADQQAIIGFHCGDDFATVYHHINSCSSGNYGATRLVIPAPGTYNPDHNPPRIAPRNIFDIGLGTDNLLHKEKVKTTLKFTVVNVTNEAALYNFLSTFSGTHWVTPRSYQLTLGWVLYK
ncbi:MAG: TonB-dependent receptor [Acidobacteriaceae bacterium]|nr:TonB-dependent receptor [Acidobacteriaceae bacterium]MBV9500815.1 TonB-dependent receptor [Acidobacteriaceae bacterium]